MITFSVQWDVVVAVLVLTGALLGVIGGIPLGMMIAQRAVIFAAEKKLTAIERNQLGGLLLKLVDKK